MTRFDPTKSIEILNGPVGIAWHLSETIEQARSDRAIEGWARGCLHLGIQAWLVGLVTDGERVLERARDWYHIAIDESEIPRRYSLHGTESIRFHDLALCNWLLTGQQDWQYLRKSLQEDEMYINNRAIWMRDLADYFIPLCYEAGEYEKGVAAIATNAKLRSSPGLMKARKASHMAYELCKHMIAHEHSETEVAKAMHRFLRLQVPSWLEAGQHATFARWMKIAFWRESEEHPTPRECLLKAFDYLSAERVA